MTSLDQLFGSVQWRRNTLATGSTSVPTAGNENVPLDIRWVAISYCFFIFLAPATMANRPREPGKNQGLAPLALARVGRRGSSLFLIPTEASALFLVSFLQESHDAGAAIVRAGHKQHVQESHWGDVGDTVGGTLY